MSRTVMNVTEETTADEVAHLLANGRLVGIVSRADLVKPSVLPSVLPETFLASAYPDRPRD